MDDEEVLDVEVEVEVGRGVIVKEEGVEMLKDTSGDELVEVEDLMRLMVRIVVYDVQVR